MRIAVEDTGIGIAADKVDAMFEPFTQMDPSRTREYQGTGLGLSIAKRMADLVGGVLGVKSETGKGSSFWLSIRLPFSGGVPSELKPEESLRGIRGLHADGSALGREILAEELTAMRIVNRGVDCAQKALDALRDAQGIPFSVIIIDTALPDMEGTELIDTIRADRTLRDLGIVVLTSLCRTREYTRIQEADDIEYLVKPVRHTELASALIHVLERR